MALMTAPHMKSQRRWDFEIITGRDSSSSLSRALPILFFPIRKTPGQLLCLWRTWHASSLCHQVPPHAFLPPQVSSRSTHRSLDEINNQPPPANKQNNRPPQLYHQPRRHT
ncbi:hypothetical protein AVEN_119095-1 [Araneus ventricosus]|uniref:Uncharacterized protein n=1 Tax=Araneus ventricosus TaxID=182803 RepID=A0A4Y2BKF5_ARAVE|nr:hypothetical protein AVEN_119095-1 [Araneus ventricosus]